MLAERKGYKIDDKHYFEYLGTWKSPLDDNLLSHIFLYREPQPTAKDGTPLPVGHPRYWISNDFSTRPMGGYWLEYANSRMS